MFRHYVIIIAAVIVCANSITSIFSQELRTEYQIMLAVQTGDLQKLKELVDKGVELPVTGPQGRPFAFLAAVQPNPDVIGFLARHGVNLNIKDEQGYTPVMAALKLGLIENAGALKSAGASSEGVAQDGTSVQLLLDQLGFVEFGPTQKKPLVTTEEASRLLLLAAENGDLVALDFAINNGAKITARAQNGWTPLMLAALGGHSKVFTNLLSNFDEKTISDVLFHEVKGVTGAELLLLSGKRNEKSAIEILEMIWANAPSLIAKRKTSLLALAESKGASEDFRQLLKNMQIQTSDEEEEKIAVADIDAVENGKADDDMASLHAEVKAISIKEICIVSDRSDFALNVRDSPQGEVINRLKNGREVEIREFDQDQNGNVWGYATGQYEGAFRVWGYLFMRDLECGANSRFHQPKSNLQQAINLPVLDTCVVADRNGSALNVRAYPNGKILYRLANGRSVEIRNYRKDSQNRNWGYATGEYKGAFRVWGYLYLEDLVCESSDVSASNAGNDESELDSLPEVIEHCVVADRFGPVLNVRDAPNGEIINRLRNGRKVEIRGYEMDSQGRPWGLASGYYKGEFRLWGFLFMEDLRC